MQITKRKVVTISGASLVFAGLIAGVIVIHSHAGNTVARSQDYGAEPGTVSGQTGSPNSIALNEAGPAPSDNSGLSVTSSNASSSIGQLDGSSQHKANGGSGSDGSSSSSAAQTLDPSTFSQYEKYKDGQGALFGDMQVGTGDPLSASHKAAVYYKGWLTNGQLFDESKPGSDGKLQPFVFTLGAHQVIPGWEQALNGMKVGGTRLVIVPPAVGYGASGQGSIPANAVLVFQVQLAAIE